MISRRALLATGAGVVAVTATGTLAALTHRLDDIAQGVGVRPRPRPVASDDTLIARVAREQNALLAQVEAVAARHAELAGDLKRFSEIGREHVRAVGGSDQVPDIARIDADPATAVVTLQAAYSRASKVRATDAGRAVSPDLARVLSSMSAGLAQCAHTVGGAR